MCSYSVQILARLKHLVDFIPEFYKQISDMKVASKYGMSEDIHAIAIKLKIRYHLHKMLHVMTEYIFFKVFS